MDLWLLKVLRTGEVTVESQVLSQTMARVIQESGTNPSTNPSVNPSARPSWVIPGALRPCPVKECLSDELTEIKLFLMMKKRRFLSLNPDSFYLLQNDFCRLDDFLCHGQVIKIFLVKNTDKGNFFPWADRLDQNI